jgi:glyoxylate carboligase
MFNQFPINFFFEGRSYKGLVKPLATGVQNRIPTSFQVFINNTYYGLMKRKEDSWETDSPKCAILKDTLGNQIYDWYQ